LRIPQNRDKLKADFFFAASEGFILTSLEIGALVVIGGAPAVKAAAAVATLATPFTTVAAALATAAVVVAVVVAAPRSALLLERKNPSLGVSALRKVDTVLALVLLFVAPAAAVVSSPLVFGAALADNDSAGISGNGGGGGNFPGADTVDGLTALRGLLPFIASSARPLSTEVCDT
jgi:hypothetical protein